MLKRVFAALLFTAAFFVPHAAEAQAPPATAMPRIALVRVYVTDIPRAERFYQQVFSLQPGRGSVERERVLAFPGEQPVLILARVDAPRAQSSDMSFAVVVSDLDATLAQVTAAGGTIAAPARDIGGGTRMAFIRDVDGNQIEMLGMSAR